MSINSKIAPPKLQHCFQGHLETGDDPVGNHWSGALRGCTDPSSGDMGREKLGAAPSDGCFSVAQSRPTLRDPVDCSKPGFPVFHYLLEFAQTHVHGVNAVQPSCLTQQGRDPVTPLCDSPGMHVLSESWWDAGGNDALGRDSPSVPHPLLWSIRLRGTAA